jgi:peptidoglycan/xylan/chitin deacetylase (PgdA/CDA1 family)
MDWMRFFVKAVLHGGNELAGRARRARVRNTDHLIVLTYHSYSPGWPTGCLHSLPIARFDRQLRWLASTFCVVPILQGLQEVQAGQKSPKPRVAITVDDGFHDNFALAYPVLRENNIPATVFVATDFIDTGRPPWPTRLAEILERTRRPIVTGLFNGPLALPAERQAALHHLKLALSIMPPEEREARLQDLRGRLEVPEELTRYPGMSWDQLREMARNGIEIGAHTVHHSILPRVPASVVVEEVKKSRARIEDQLQRPCTQFAYPDGKHDVAARAAVEQAGFEIAVTQDPGVNNAQTDALTLRRVDIPYHDPYSSFRWRVSSPRGV